MANFDESFNVKHYLGPESLADLCFKTICNNLDIISYKNNNEYRVLAKGLVFPSEICDKMIEFAHKSDNVEVNDFFFYIFSDIFSTRLRNVKVSHSSITDISIKKITRHQPVHLAINDCGNLTRLSIEFINQGSKNLTSLSIRGCPNIHAHDLTNYLDLSTNYMKRGYVFNTPHLKHLALEYIKVAPEQYPILLSGLSNLTFLDLSNAANVGNFEFVSLVPNLVSLCLYNVKISGDAQAFVANVTQLKKLRHLDISHANHKNGYYNKPNQILAELVSGLPNLESLDIGGTNLAGRGVAERSLTDKPTMDYALCDIQGLACRVNNPLQFLGLYGTRDEACRRHDIPARIIAGDANDEQILVAARVCIDHKQDLLQKVLNDLYHIFRHESCERLEQALCLILEAMEKHLNERHIQISGSATLFYIVKTKEISGLVSKMKRRIIGALLAGMCAHKDEETMMRNGCLALCQFRIPQDVMWNYETLVKLLLHSTRHTESEGFVQRIGIYLLNSLACQVEGRKKRLLGKLGCVETMLELVQYRVECDLHDDVLEVAWSTMWNMTDETPVNCQRFLDENGMNLFLRCVEQYPTKEELLRNMMGLLGNVAEVDYLRPDLMQRKYVSVFSNLLEHDRDGIEVSYNATGILAHMASDGVEAWTVDSPTREEVLKRMVKAIERWDLSAQRNINYRSFMPLLRLLDVFHTPQCQHWAVWALANLTQVYPNKYCSLVKSEGGIEKLNNLIYDSRPYSRIKDLATSVIYNCSSENFNNKQQETLESPSEVDLEN
ncbi:protein zer-1 homolog [Chelonus insularis]|uniref:protein zer-1 homolog n=1 Tax=Chelonus insularis TaxID=460826 RepID=UPI00158EE0B5|nr:protein zer-1 homolog [Chelonus insularis]XP_034938972.1 protein zer-1 homolog [Chelonus insularis]